MAGKEGEVELDMNDDNEIVYLDHTKDSTSMMEREPKVLDKPFKLGNCIAFCYSGGNPMFTIGPHWKQYLISNLFIIGLSCTFLISLISQITFFGTLVGAFILVCQVVTYAVTSLVNPGLPDLNFNRPGAAKEADKKYDAGEE